MLVAFWTIGIVALLALLAVVVIGDFLDGIFDALDFSGGGYFSSSAVFAFFAAFGFGGAITYSQTENLALSSAVALGAGLLFGAFGGALTHALTKGETAHQVKSSDYVGLKATVTTAIRPGQLGQVFTSVAGHSTTLAARSEVDLDSGKEVEIVGILAPGTVSVKPVVN